MGNGLKTCVICGKDCAGQPRIKDKKGNYYHKTCYEQAKARKAPPAEAAPEPLAIQGDEPGGFDPFADHADSPAAEAPPVGPNACPSCGNALQAGSVMCMNCGYNLQGGKQVSTKVRKPEKVRSEGRDGGPGIANLIKNPLVVSASLFFTMLLLMMAAGSASETDVVGAFCALILIVIILAINIFVLVTAFQEGIGTGFLSLCLPFYILYYVYGVSESSWVKWLFTAGLLANILSYILMPLEF